MSADLTWGEVLSKFSSLVQQYDKGDTIVESRCRSLFAEAVPSTWLREHGLSISPQRIRMKKTRTEPVEGILAAPSVKVFFSENHPKYVSQFDKSPKKVCVSADTLCLQKIDGIWAPAGCRLNCSFYEDMLDAERQLIELHTANLFAPANCISEVANRIGRKDMAELYQAFLPIDPFPPPYAKPFSLDDILMFSEKAAK